MGMRPTGKPGQYGNCIETVTLLFLCAHEGGRKGVMS